MKRVGRSVVKGVVKVLDVSPVDVFRGSVKASGWVAGRAEAACRRAGKALRLLGVKMEAYKVVKEKE